MDEIKRAETVKENLTGIFAEFFPAETARHASGIKGVE